jgi:hypothetical protein
MNLAFTRQSLKSLKPPFDDCQLPRFEPSANRNSSIVRRLIFGSYEGSNRQAVVGVYT